METTTYLTWPLLLAALALGLLGVSCGAGKGPSHARVDATEAVRAALAAAGGARLEADVRATEQALRNEPDWQLVDQHEVTALVARDQRVWAGTGGGVLFWDDGHLRQRATALDGLQPSTVTALHLAGEAGPLYVGHANGACLAFDEPERLRDGRPCAGNEAGRVSEFVELDGAVYAVSFEGGAVPVEPAPGLARLAVPARASAVVACGDAVYSAGLATSRDGEGVLGGLSRVDESGATSIASPPVLEALACAADGTLWAGGPSGLYRLDPRSSAPALERAAARLPRPHVRFIEQRGDRLFVGLATGQLAVFSPPAPQHVQVYDLPGLYSRAAFGSRLWLGGERGLVVLDVDQGRAVEVATPGPGSADVSALAVPSAGDAEAAAGLAVGMFRRGVAIWSGDRWRRYDRVAGLPSDEINALAYDRFGALWVGTASGLGRVRDGRAEVVASAAQLGCGHVNALHVEDDALVAATGCGVLRFDLRSGEVLERESVAEGLPHRIVYDVTRWNGVLVAGTNDGLAVRDAAEPERPWRRIRAGRSALDDNWISALEVAADGALVVGTYGGGVYRGATPDTIARVDGPRAVNLTALARVGDEVWVGSLDQGAFAIDGEGVARRTEQGRCVLGGEVTAFTEWRGQLLVSTRLGASALRC